MSRSYRKHLPEGNGHREEKVSVVRFKNPKKINPYEKYCLYDPNGCLYDDLSSGEIAVCFGAKGIFCKKLVREPFKK